MKPVRALLTLQIIASASLTGCAAPGNDESAGGPSFIQMPGESRGLVGATPQYLSAAFGQPAILRVDGTAQVWLYHAGDCGLNLILYPDSAGTPRVAMAAPTDDGADINACSAALARAHVAAAGAPLPALAQPLPAAIIPAAVRQPAAAPVVLPAGAAGDGLERASSS